MPPGAFTRRVRASVIPPWTEISRGTWFLTAKTASGSTSARPPCGCRTVPACWALDAVTYANVACAVTRRALRTLNGSRASCRAVVTKGTLCTMRIEVTVSFTIITTRARARNCAQPRLITVMTWGTQDGRGRSIWTVRSLGTLFIQKYGSIVNLRSRLRRTWLFLRHTSMRLHPLRHHCRSNQRCNFRWALSVPPRRNTSPGDSSDTERY